MTPPPFYVDETYGPRLVGLLEEMNLRAVTYRDVPDINAADPDTAWIPIVANRKWIALTHDKKLRSKRAERQAIQNARLRVVVIATKDSTEDEAASVIGVHRKSVLALAHYMPPPFIISLTRQRLDFTWLGP